MKFALTSLALLASFGAVFAQDTSSSSAASSSSSASSSSAPASTSASSSAAGGGGGGASSSMATATCTLVSGDPKVHQFGCPEGAVTSTPPYNSASLLSYQIAAFTAGKEGQDVSAVASQMANTVRELYPTLTVSYSDIVQQYASVLEASAYPDGAASAINVPSGLGAMAVVAVAAVAGGAFIL